MLELIVGFVGGGVAASAVIAIYLVAGLVTGAK